MDEGYYCTEEGDCSHSALDELFCEYVDGTMDADVRAVFEEYLDANPEMRRHAEALMQAKSLLCGCRGPKDCHSVNARVRRRLAGELLQDEVLLPPDAAERLGTMAGIASATAMLVLLGMLVGTLLPVEQIERASQQPMVQVSEQAARPMTPLLPDRFMLKERGPLLLSTSFSAARSYVPEVIHLADSVRSVGLQRTHGAP